MTDARAYGPPIEMTAMVGLPTAVTALISSTCCGGRSLLAVSDPSPSVSSLDHADRPPTARMTTSAFRAAATAAGMSVGSFGTTPVPATAVTSAFGSSCRTASARDTAEEVDLRYYLRSNSH